MVPATRVLSFLVFLAAPPSVFEPDSAAAWLPPSSEETRRTPSDSTLQPDSNGVFRTRELASGVWAAVVRARPSAYAFANSLVVEGRDGVLVVDTQQSPTAARALLELLRERTDAPVRWVVNTHWHGDHVNGNQVYRSAFPEVRFVAHRTTRRDMLEEGRAFRDREIADLPGTIEARRRWLDTGRGPDGEELGPEDRAAVRRSLELRQAYLEELRNLRETPPDVTFSDRLTLRLGGRVVELLHLGPAHTAGDVVVLLPDEGVAAVGDLLEEGPLWLEGADVPGWAGALRRLREMDPKTVLPSHGDVQGEGDLLRLQAAFLESVVEAARGALERGADEEQAVRSADLHRFREGFARLGLEGEAFERHAEDAVREAYRDLAAGLGDPRWPR